MATVYRIASAGTAWDESDLQGKGAKATGGRWNKVGSPMLYCGSSIALAVLETIVHLGAGAFPMNRCIIEIRIPDEEFVKRRIVSEKDLPDAWNSRPVSFKSKAFGTDWIKGNTALVMQVPSVIMPLESNFLLNPLHPGMVKASAINLGQHIYDPRNVPGSAKP